MLRRGLGFTASCGSIEAFHMFMSNHALNYGKQGHYYSIRAMLFVFEKHSVLK